MAVPKIRTSKARTRRRRAVNMKLSAPTIVQ
ncbi:MAG: 50S ribosomal protein L32, partial [Spirochaetales bacterium]|nr:50S ribosomal protein L32 [Spirochaetales bacterium]